MSIYFRVLASANMCHDVVTGESADCYLMARGMEMKDDITESEKDKLKDGFAKIVGISSENLEFITAEEYFEHNDEEGYEEEEEDASEEEFTDEFTDELIED